MKYFMGAGNATNFFESRLECLSIVRNWQPSSTREVLDISFHSVSVMHDISRGFADWFPTPNTVHDNYF